MKGREDEPPRSLSPHYESVRHVSRGGVLLHRLAIQLSWPVYSFCPSAVPCILIPLMITLRRGSAGHA